MVRGAVRGYMEIVLVLKKSCDHSEDKGLPFPLRGTDGHLLRDALKVGLQSGSYGVWIGPRGRYRFHEGFGEEERPVNP